MKQPAARRPWTAEEIARLKDLLEKNMSPAQIAEELDRPLQALRAQAARHGFTTRVSKKAYTKR